MLWGDKSIFIGLCTPIIDQWPISAEKKKKLRYGFFSYIFLFKALHGNGF